jgi:hypothetical protein
MIYYYPFLENNVAHVLNRRLSKISLVFVGHWVLDRNMIEHYGVI